MASLTEAETEVNPELGYPSGYAKLCKSNIYYSKGPPQTFLPYSLHPHEDLNKLFPFVSYEEPNLSTIQAFVDVLWKQLDHLGNAGFDPALFRVDPYGNVLYFHADPASPLAWKIDHWFPLSRGGKSVASNLRIVQWQAKERKGERLEFLVPWWDLQLGLSVNQFLSIFASQNSDFRQRALSFVFFSGKSEQLHERMVADSHSWPQHFLEKKKQFGLAAAALVRVQRKGDSSRKASNTNLAIKAGGQFSGKRWTAEEDEALLKSIQKFRPGSGRESEQSVAKSNNNLIVPVEEKLCSKRAEIVAVEESESMKDFRNIELALCRAIRKEQILRHNRDEEIRKKLEELFKLRGQLNDLIKANEAERVALEDLEYVLVKHRRSTEKQRRLAEKTASYKQCMEKMIRETMHQNVVYKEQARLNQAACNALMARLESLKADSDVTERELWKKLKQREEIKEFLRPYLEQEKKRLREDDTTTPRINNKACKPTEERRIRHHSDSNFTTTKLVSKDKDSSAAVLEQDTAAFLCKTVKENSKLAFQKELRELLEEDTDSSRLEAALALDDDEVDDKKSSSTTTDGQENRVLTVCQDYGESVGDNDKEDDVWLQQEQEKVQECDDEEERIKQAGKANIDRWLQILLDDTQTAFEDDAEQGKENKGFEDEKLQEHLYDRPLKKHHNVCQSLESEADTHLPKRALENLNALSKLQKYAGRERPPPKFALLKLENQQNAYQLQSDDDKADIAKKSGTPVRHGGSYIKHELAAPHKALKSCSIYNQSGRF